MHSSSKAAALLVILGLFLWAWLQLAPLLGEAPAKTAPLESAGLREARELAQETLPELLWLLDVHKDSPYVATLWARVPNEGGSTLVQLEQLKFSLRGLSGRVRSVEEGTAGIRPGSPLTVRTRDMVDWSFQAEGEPVRGHLVACWRLYAGAASADLMRQHAQDPQMCRWADAHRAKRGLRPWFGRPAVLAL